MTDNQQSPEKKETASATQGDAKQKGSADFDKLVEEAEADTQTRKPGASGGNQSSQHNNGRGGGK